MVFERLEEGSPNDEPEVCTTIEEVGSTGVGSLTIAFIILVICGCCFLYKAVNSGAQKKYASLSSHARQKFCRLRSTSACCFASQPVDAA